jgi:hypothetical protein
MDTFLAPFLEKKRDQNGAALVADVRRTEKVEVLAYVRLATSAVAVSVFDDS